MVGDVFREWIFGVEMKRSLFDSFFDIFCLFFLRFFFFGKKF